MGYLGYGNEQPDTRPRADSSFNGISFTLGRLLTDDEIVDAARARPNNGIDIGAGANNLRDAAKKITFRWDAEVAAQLIASAHPGSDGVHEYKVKKTGEFFYPVYLEVNYNNRRYLNGADAKNLGGKVARFGGIHGYIFPNKIDYWRYSVNQKIQHDKWYTEIVQTLAIASPLIGGLIAGPAIIPAAPAASLATDAASIVPGVTSAVPGSFSYAAYTAGTSIAPSVAPVATNFSYAAYAGAANVATQAASVAPTAASIASYASGAASVAQTAPASIVPAAVKDALGFVKNTYDIVKTGAQVAGAVATGVKVVNSLRPKPVVESTYVPSVDSGFRASDQASSGTLPFTPGLVVVAAVGLFAVFSF